MLPQQLNPKVSYVHNQGLLYPYIIILLKVPPIIQLSTLAFYACQNSRGHSYIWD